MRIDHSLWVLTAALALCTGCDSTSVQHSNPIATEPVASSALDAVIADYVRDFAPDPHGGQKSDDVSAVAFLNIIAGQKELLQRARDLSADGLGPAEDIDRRLLIGVLESSIHLSESRRVWENNPALYLPVGKIVAALEPDEGMSNQAKLQKLDALLTTLPARLGHAHSNLKHPPKRFTEAAI